MEKRQNKLTKAQKYVPNDMKKLSCCPKCRLILDARQWSDTYGRRCPNCGTTDIEARDFQGMISLIMPSESWVAKWNLLEDSMPGVYAIKILSDAQTEREEMQEQIGYGEEEDDGFIVDDDEEEEMY